MNMPNGYEILPVVIDDVAALGEMLLSSKMELTVNRLLWKDWPNEAAQRPQYTSAVGGGLKNPAFETFKVVDSGSQKIIGYMALARQQPVDPSAQDDQAEATQHPPEGIDRDVYRMVIDAASEINRDFEFEHRYELVYIVVEQSHRRRGIGSELMRICFERAEAASLPLVVGSEPAAHSFFVKLGFEDRRHADMDLKQWAPPFTGFGTFRLTAMRWRPTPSNT